MTQVRPEPAGARPTDGVPGAAAGRARAAAPHAADAGRARAAVPHAAELPDYRLRPPRSKLEAVRREALIRRLEQPGPTIVVMSAPSGYGKSITLAQWADHDPRPFAWLVADGSLNDPLALLTHLAAALGRVADVDPAVGRWLQLAVPPVTERILPSLAANAAAAPPFVLVIDDVHLLTDEACWQLLSVPLRSVSPGSCVCVSGRRTPGVPLARLRAAGLLIEIGPGDLALSSAETRELLLRQGAGADHATVVQVEQVTEGWAAGVYMAALACREGACADWPAGVGGRQRDIARYLAFEVLGPQDADVRGFLLETAILERLSAPLCRAVTGRPDAGDLLRRVAHENLFISPLDDRDEWFRYHHLFADFMRAELERRDEAAVAKLHARAADWYEQHEQPEQAVRHWLAAGDVRRAGEIVCRAFMTYSRSGRLETVRRWLRSFSDEQIAADDALMLTAGWIGAMTADERGLDVWVVAALHEIVEDRLWPGSTVSLRAMQASLRAALGRDGLTSMLADAEHAAALSVGADLAERAAVDTVLGAARWLSGDPDAAAAAFVHAEEEGAAANAVAEIGAAGLHALLLADAGRWDEAEQLAVRAVRRMEECGFGWTPVVNAQLAHARVLTHKGDREAAAERAAAAAAILEAPGASPWFALLSTVHLAEVLFELGDADGASRRLQDGLARLAAWPDAGILGPRLEGLLARLEKVRAGVSLTPAERRILELLPTELSLKEVAGRLGVSRDTVKSHVGDLYRKLGVHTRSQAVARARLLRLLA